MIYVRVPGLGDGKQMLASKMARGVSLINHNRDSEPANARQSRVLACVTECNTYRAGCKGVVVSKYVCKFLTLLPPKGGV